MIVSVSKGSTGGGMDRRETATRLPMAPLAPPETVRDRPFTIVSNNCWGAELYPLLGRPYETPFVRLVSAR